MARYILTFEIEDTFYQEFFEKGISQEMLLEQLRLDTQDQLDEYDLPQLMNHILSTKPFENLTILVPKIQ